MTINPPIVSAITAGVLLILQLILMIGAIRARLRDQQSLGDGGKPGVIRAVRRHGNFAENAALFAVSFVLLEMLGESRTMMAVLCAAFVVGRLLHAAALSRENTVNGLRSAGVVLTIAVGVAIAVRLVMMGVASL